MDYLTRLFAWFRRLNRRDKTWVASGVLLLSCCWIGGGLAGVGALLSDDDPSATPAPRSIAADIPTRTSERQATSTAADEPNVTREDPTETEDGEEPTSTVESLPEPTNAFAPEPTATDDPQELTPTEAPPQRMEVAVIQIVDGDTIRVRISGFTETVRLIGIDTPETKARNEPIMCFGPEATAFTREMVQRANNRVLLEKDVSETDSFGRLLRYVWLPHSDGTRFLNEELVKQGYAQASTFPPDVKYADLFAEQARQAREENAGLWGSCGEFGVPAATPTPVPTTTPQPAPTATPVPTSPPAQNCHPSYPSVCIPPPPPDLDCPEIPYTNFTVTGSDPHGFDRDNDGIGCEN